MARARPVRKVIEGREQIGKRQGGHGSDRKALSEALQRPESSSRNELRQDSNLGAEVWGGEGHLKTKSGEVDVRAARGSKKKKMVGGRVMGQIEPTGWWRQPGRH